MKIFLARAALKDVIALSDCKKRLYSNPKNRVSPPSSSGTSTDHLQSATNSPSSLSTLNPNNSPGEEGMEVSRQISSLCWKYSTKLSLAFSEFRSQFQCRVRNLIIDERGDVPGWVLVVLMTTGLVTGIWTVAAPRIESLLRGSLDSMNNVR